MPNFPQNQPGDVTIFRTPPLALPQTGVKTLFAFVGGGGSAGGGQYNPTIITSLWGIITVGVGAVANATKLQALMDALAAVDLCATLDVNGLLAGNQLAITGTLANAMTSNVNGVSIGQTTPIQVTGGLQTGIIQVNCAGSDGGVGRVVWIMSCRPAYGVRVVVAGS